MLNLTTKDNQLQRNQHQEAQTAFMASHGRDNGPSEHRVAKVTITRGNNGAGPTVCISRGTKHSIQREQDDWT